MVAAGGGTLVARTMELRKCGSAFSRLASQRPMQSSDVPYTLAVSRKLPPAVTYASSMA